MATHETPATIDGDLSALATHDVDAARVERIRMRCTEALVSRHRRWRGRSAHPAQAWRWLESAVAFGLGAVYLAAAFAGSLALYR